MSKTPPSADDYCKRAAAASGSSTLPRTTRNGVASCCAGSNRRSSRWPTTRTGWPERPTRRKNRRRKCDGARAPPRRFERPTRPVDGSGCKAVQPGGSAGFSQRLSGIRQSFFKRQRESPSLASGVLKNSDKQYCHENQPAPDRDFRCLCEPGFRVNGTALARRADMDECRLRDARRRYDAVLLTFATALWRFSGRRM